MTKNKCDQLSGTRLKELLQDNGLNMSASKARQSLHKLGAKDSNKVRVRVCDGKNKYMRGLEGARERELGM